MKWHYHYEGYVFLDGHMVLKMWRCDAEASNCREAKAHLCNKFKEQYGIKGKHRIRLHGKFKKLEAVM